MSSNLRDAWGLKCACAAKNAFATWRSSQCDLHQKFPLPGPPVTDTTEEA